MNIGQAADATGVSAKRIRYYEQIGLLTPAARTESGYRQYDGGALHTLSFINRARELGFSIAEITDLLALWRNDQRSNAKVKTIALGHIEALRQKIAGMQSMQDTLQHLADSCDGDARAECPILDELQRIAS